MLGTSPIFSAKLTDWETPEAVLELVRKIRPIGLDPCTKPRNPTKAQVFFTRRDNGLKQDWRDACPPGTLCFVNPPYGRHVGLWTGLAAASWVPEMVLLVPARTDTVWWHRLWPYVHAACFWRGRMQYTHPRRRASTKAAFPSALLYRGPEPERFCGVFASYGIVLRTRR